MKDAENANNICQKCKGKMHFYDTIHLWICENSPQCDFTLVNDDECLLKSKENTVDIDIRCPVCQSQMFVKRNIFTHIICRSKTCGFKLDPRLSAGLVKIWSMKKGKNHDDSI
jgi:ssDNA-binding Zn-finger/Zn-ribbon topoisomerase 1